MARDGLLLLIIPVFFLFIFIFLFLPTQCDDSTYYMHDHCHQMRHIGISCTPEDNCWYQNHHTPGPYGFVLILVAFGSVALCVFSTPEEEHVSTLKRLPIAQEYIQRKKRFFDKQTI